MTHSDRNAATGRLWARARAEWRLGRQTRPADPNEIAAYLDGRADESSRDRLEAAALADETVLDLLASSRSALDAGPGTAPAGVAAAARRLMASEAPRRRFTMARTPRAPRLAWRPVMQGAMAAAVLVAAVVSFELGRQAAPILLPQPEAQEEIGELAWVLSVEETL